MSEEENMKFYKLECNGEIVGLTEKPIPCGNTFFEMEANRNGDLNTICPKCGKVVKLHGTRGRKD